MIYFLYESLYLHGIKYIKQKGQTYYCCSKLCDLFYYCHYIALPRQIFFCNIGSNEYFLRIDYL